MNPLNNPPTTKRQNLGLTHEETQQKKRKADNQSSEQEVNQLTKSVFSVLNQTKMIMNELNITKLKAFNPIILGKLNQIMLQALTKMNTIHPHLLNQPDEVENILLETEKPGPFEMNEYNQAQFNRIYELISEAMQNLNNDVGIEGFSNQVFSSIKEVMTAAMAKTDKLVQTALIENTNLTNELKQMFVKKLTEPTRVEDFRLIFESIKNKPALQKIWREATADQAVILTPFTFQSANQTFTTTLPRTLWNAHSPYFENTTKSPMKKEPLIDNVSSESLQMFIRSLEQCSSSETLTRDNCKELWILADKYQVSWLAADCERFLEEVCIPFKEFQQKIENLIDGAQFRKPVLVLSSVISLYELWQSINLSEMASTDDKEMLRAQLEELADEYQLADLKLLVTCENARMLPDYSVSVSFRSDQIPSSAQKKAIKKCLEMKNWWGYRPHIELHYEQLPTGKDFGSLLPEITENAVTLFSIKLSGKIPRNLNSLLNKMPEVKFLRINYNCNEYPIKFLAELIKNNDSLEGLHLTLNRFEKTNYEWKTAESDFRKALKFNYTLNQAIIIESDLQIDPDSTYTDEIVVEDVTYSHALAQTRDEYKHSTSHFFKHAGR